ncbi:MAG: polyprenyl synthetase family protein [Clostridiales bacterium]|nr:polyprenyl synthetase family protein [Clostridiales bacterium]MCD7828311.1 polyprenyl synthetase family protein [Clostridiales bacterium]
MTIFDEYTKKINSEIMDFIPKTMKEYSVISDAMKYSLESGGKRIRPVLTLEFCRISGGDVDRAMPYAAAVEFVHTYSLIHDDLPCMDNDDMRRGKPSSHKMFGEATALLAGDALLTHAFTCLSSADLKPEQTVKAVKVLSEFAGVNGMIGGQAVDLAGEGKTYSVDELFLMDRLKTSALIKSACVLGCIAAENYQNIETAENFGENLGLAFQIIDDILDYLEGEENSDIVSDKSTYVSLLGIDKARETADMYTEKALSALDELAGDTSFLRYLSEYLLGRTS